MSDKQECACRPGSVVNGWHEVRCKPCRDVELQEWIDISAAWAEWNWRDDVAASPTADGNSDQ